MKHLGGTELKRLHRGWRQRTPARVALVLEDVQGPFNVGGIVRTAAAYRVNPVWVAGRTPDLADAKVARTALGTERYLEERRVPTGEEAVTAARAEGFEVVAVELAEGAEPLPTLATGPDVCLVVGNEDHGIGRATLEACDAVAYLPQLGRVGSLNVATAAALAIYEIRRRSWDTAPAG
jgi:tRNA (guanosine-2'-O-)-methyltransferase